jgi:hypothetical protein
MHKRRRTADLQLGQTKAAIANNTADMGRVTMRLLFYALGGLSSALAIASFAVAQEKVPQNRPPSVYVDIGACPFECCTYRQWKVNDAVTLRNEPRGGFFVTSLDKGDIVEGLTGEVISIPRALKADRDIPETRIKAGDTFYILHYDGEGYWKAWFRGRVTYVHQSVVNVPRIRADWWVKVKDAAGNVGWALSDRHFLHQDACE